VVQHLPNRCEAPSSNLSTEKSYGEEYLGVLHYTGDSEDLVEVTSAPKS
jgi:hypothetical protein